MSDDEYAAIIAFELQSLTEGLPQEEYERRALRAGVWIGVSDLAEIEARKAELFLALAHALINNMRDQYGEEGYQRAKREATAQRRGRNT